ncbi:MAG: TetR/AcrR family transcriptional regulator, partial [Pusillimonas sp.]|nr:TetR/AcrR family transcriptional regulator [Pusillimonas sp.]
EEHLTPTLRKKSEASRRLVLDRFVTAIEAGIKAGQFRDVEPKVTAFALLGMCNWGAWWFNPKGAIALEQVVNSIVNLALSAVVRGEERRLRNESIDETMRQLREDLNLLEKRLDIKAVKRG